MTIHCSIQRRFSKLLSTAKVPSSYLQVFPQVSKTTTVKCPSFFFADAKFWVGAGPTPSPQGIRVPDENGKEQPLRRYDRKAIVLTLPGDLTIHQIGHFGVWCEAFTVDFGHVQIPQNLNVPPSLKMLGVSPQVSWKGFL